jgi:hypothetical protein
VRQGGETHRQGRAHRNTARLQSVSWRHCCPLSPPLLEANASRRRAGWPVTHSECPAGSGASPAQRRSVDGRHGEDRSIASGPAAGVSPAACPASPAGSSAAAEAAAGSGGRVPADRPGSSLSRGCRRSTATSWRSTSRPASFDAAERASSAIHPPPGGRTIRYNSVPSQARDPASPPATMYCELAGQLPMPCFETPQVAHIETGRRWRCVFMRAVRGTSAGVSAGQASVACNRSVTIRVTVRAMPGDRLPAASCSSMRRTWSARPARDHGAARNVCRWSRVAAGMCGRGYGDLAGRAVSLGCNAC